MTNLPIWRNFVARRLKNAGAMQAPSGVAVMSIPQKRVSPAEARNRNDAELGITIVVWVAGGRRMGQHWPGLDDLSMRYVIELEIFQYQRGFIRRAVGAAAHMRRQQGSGPREHRERLRKQGQYLGKWSLTTGKVDFLEVDPKIEQGGCSIILCATSYGRYRSILVGR